LQTILVVDDNDSMRAVIVRHVRNLNGAARFLECKDGKEAVEAYARIRPEWVLMDVKMPGMDGLSAAKEILTKFPEARIIMVSNFDDPDLRNEAKRNGAVGYILKERLFELKEMIGS
jgi:CheY-like chemotaxis protein